MAKIQNISKDRLLMKTNPFSVPQCASCEHFNGDGTCKAFYDFIPDQIWNNSIEHNKPVSGQNNNIVYKRRENEEE